MTPAHDLLGKEFGQLKVIGCAPRNKSGQARWHCYCACGTTTTIHQKNLLQGRSKSCGCRRMPVDMAGWRFTLLLVLSRHRGEGPQGHRGGPYWNCICDCGKPSVVAGESLRAGKTMSCGCWGRENLRKENRLLAGESGFRQLYAIRRNAAREQGQAWELGAEEFRALTSSNCSYCGKPPSRVSQRAGDGDKRYSDEGRKLSAYVYTGVMRVDRARGWTVDNCRPWCRTCHVPGRRGWPSWSGARKSDGSGSRP